MNMYYIRTAVLNALDLYFVSFGDPTYIYTRGSKSFEEAWYTVEDRTDFVFMVKACEDVHIALAKNAIITTDFTIEISLGVESNSRSRIGYVFEAEGLFDTYTTGILHCNEYRTFWLQWRDGYIQVGWGAAVGEQTFMNLQDAVDHAINAIGLASDNGNAATWQINENIADRLAFFTQTEYKHDQLWKSIENKNFWHFSVKAAGHAHVAITEQLGVTSSNVVEFVIGGWDNNRTVIRTGIHGYTGEIVRDEWTPDILSENQHRNFWIGWMNGTMEAGRGTIYGRHRLLRWHGSHILPRFLSVSTGFGAKGDWLFQDDQEGLSYIFTRKRESRRHITWMELPQKDFFTFQVQACQHAIILLCTNKTLVPGTTIEVTIGEHNNTKTNFRYLDQAPFAEVDTIEVTTCHQPKYFWLSWNNNNLRLGYWHIYDNNLILEEELSTPVDIRAVGIETPHEVGIWMISNSMAERIDFYTPEAPEFGDFNDVWRTVNFRQWFVFSVKACSDAHIGIAPAPGVEHEEVYYDIVISGWENTRTQIRRVLHGERTDASEPVDTPGLLNCGSPRQFWVMWLLNEISVGRGAIPGHHHIITDVPLDIYPIKAVSIASGFGHEATWYMDDDTSDFLYFYNNERVTTENVLALRDDVTWITFKVRSCRDAVAILYATEGGGAPYEVVFGAKNNTQTLIRINGVEVVSADRSHFSCEDERSVWISWQDGLIQVGFSSLLGEFPVLVYRDNNPNLNINRMNFRSGATEYEAHTRWKISYVTAMWTSFKTSTDYDFHSVWESVEHRTGLVFSVQACSDVHVLLSDIVRHTDFRYEVVIGGWENTRSVIRMHGVREYVAASTPDINSCTQSRSFWITWVNKVIEVGYGEIFGTDRFMSYHPADFPTVRAIGYSTGYGFNGTWTIKLLDELYPTSPPATEAPEPPEEGGGESSLTSGDVAGIVIGVLALVAVGGVLAVLILRQDNTSPLASLMSSGQDSDTAQIVQEDVQQQQEPEAAVVMDDGKESTGADSSDA